MLTAVGMTFDGDVSTLSFRESNGWTRVSPDKMSPPSQWISIGDPECGPAVQLGICLPVSEKLWLDTHYHASDQLRVVVQGGFQLQRKLMGPGDFGYQVAGIPYREAIVPGDGDALWMFALQAERRGARSTTTRLDGSFELGEVAEDQLDRPVDSPDDPYWLDVPGGSKGRAALATSEGRTIGGFNWGKFDDAASWAAIAEGVTGCAALLGDVVAGPMVITMRAAAGTVIMLPIMFDTETVVAPVAGTLLAGDDRLEAGDVRFERTGAQRAALVAGDRGVDLVYVIADRRALSQAGSDDRIVRLAALREELSHRIAAD